MLDTLRTTIDSVFCFSLTGSSPKVSLSLRTSTSSLVYLLVNGQSGQRSVFGVRVMCDVLMCTGSDVCEKRTI
jgi:hypothetical protein